MTKNDISAIFNLSVGLLYLIFSMKYNPGDITNPQPGFFPRIIGMIVVSCSLLLLLSSLRRREQKDKLNVIWEGFTFVPKSK